MIIKIRLPKEAVKEFRSIKSNSPFLCCTTLFNFSSHFTSLFFSFVQRPKNLKQKSWCVRTHFYFVVDNHLHRFVVKKCDVERVKKITIQDVARYANVSAGTIDRVIHNRGKVSPEKRHKVKEAIKKLNFNPNLLARTLAMGKTFSVSTLIPSAPYPGHYWSMPCQGIDLAATRYKDYGIITENHFYDKGLKFEGA